MTKPPDETAQNLEAFLAKAARLSNIPTVEDVRAAQEADMAATQKALLSYSVPPVTSTFVSPAPQELPPEPPKPNILPPRTVRVARFGDKKHDA